MICPSCATGVRLPISGSSDVFVATHPTEKQWGFDVAEGFCPECNALIVLLRRGTYWQQGLGDDASRELYPAEEEVIYPHRRSKPISPEVPERYRNDFIEAFACLDVSPKASAAVARRLLQDVIENHFQIRSGSLEKQIVAFIAIAGVPSLLVEQVDAVRKIGNFGAHPLKSTNTGEVLDVEPGEAEWLLGTLEGLFDFAFVHPKRLERQKAKLNEKLADAGKPPMK